MPYYAQYGNYAAGDNYGRYGHYAAGGIFSSLGKLAKGALSIAAGAIPVVGSSLQRAIAGPQIVPQAPGGFTGIQLPGIAIGSGTPTAYGFGPQAGAVPRLMAPGMNGCGTGCCTTTGKRGHLNKSTYVTRGGGTSRWPQQLIVHERGTECVTSRRMNVANPKALRKAIRRGRGAVKLLRGAAGMMGYSVVTKAALAKRPKARRR